MSDGKGRSYCVACGKKLWEPGKPFGSHKCSSRVLRKREREEAAEEERVENYTIRDEDDPDLPDIPELK